MDELDIIFEKMVSILSTKERSRIRSYLENVEAWEILHFLDKTPDYSHIIKTYQEGKKIVAIREYMQINGLSLIVQGDLKKAKLDVERLVSGISLGEIE